MERSLTQFRWALLIGDMLMLGVLAGLFLRMERLSSVASSEVLYVRSLRLVDAQGQNRILLDGGGEQGIASLLVLDGKQHPRLQAVVSRPGEAHGSLLDQNGTQRWSLSLMADGTVLVDTKGVMEGTVREVPVVKDVTVPRTAPRDAEESP